MKGTIAGKIDLKGFGFINPEGKEDNRENNIFFHATALEGISFESIAIGTAVEFDIEPSDKGDRAVRIRCV